MNPTRLLLTFLLLSSVSIAAEYQPYADAKITAEQWQEYYAIVDAEFADTMEDLLEAKLRVYRDDASATFYAFTMVDHPAYPAWITRRVVERNGAISIEQIGYFAGEETPFAALFDDYSALADELQAEFKAQQALEEE